MNEVKLEEGLLLVVHQYVHRQAILTPHRTAVRFKSEEITYADLYQKASRIAFFLDEFYSSEKIIGICTSRDIDTIVSICGILMSGKAYLPLDPNYPSGRLLQILKDSEINLCLVSSGNHQTLAQSGLKIISAVQCYTAKVEKRIIERKTSLAYILYTSGSTGKPKGVSMGHAPLVNLLEWQFRESQAGEGTNTMQFAPLSFDVSFQEIFATLGSGGTLVLVEDDIRLDPFRLLAFIKNESVNRIFLPFVALQQLAETAGSNNTFPDCLLEVMTAGEQLKITPQLVNLFASIPGCKLFNQYGPTEAHVVTQLVLEGIAEDWPSLPNIGIPIANTDIYIIDQNGTLLPDGETGELIISGVCLAEGYLNDPDLTVKKFTSWEHPRLGSLRVYLSGDLARYLPDGNIEFLGRKDDQVKIRGHRVEPGEIEVVLNNYPGVEQAVVIARADNAGQKRLLAYLKLSDKSIDLKDVRKYIEAKLPQYMIPSAFVEVTVFPKTTSGKVDKNALPDAEIKRPDLATAFRAASTVTEQRIAEVWAGLLQMDRVGTDDDFFALGGNSLLAVKTIVQLRERFKMELPVTKLYQFPTIKTIAHFLDKGEEAPDSAGQKTRLAPSSQDVAVIGMAGRFPGADTIEELWQLLIQGKETTRFFTDDELDSSVSISARRNPDYVKARGIINGADMFDPSFFGINNAIASLMDPQQRIFLEIAWEVLEKTGYLPVHYDGSIGVFAGCGNNTYYINNVQSNKDLIEQVGPFQVMTVNEKDYIATRTAFHLNLKGPAISLNTGCSTSLLAISQAVENIRAGRCDIAIAGGVAITAPIHSGQFYEEGAMFSKDGHCRPFDANAGGTVFSDGAGVVLLKPLDLAMADGDTIFAVVKGIGYNNDGGNKASFTAPSAQGQAGAVRQAIADAGIIAAQISYIETHGTATPLGDPIEIEGLTMAFGGQSANQFCAIGSVKSNMGHLTAAAGVAGFIKTVLSIYNKQLPPSIHFKSPNPQINFQSSPFYVNTHLRSWATEERFAGVSSFGVGGTNVHVILGAAEAAKTTSIRNDKPAQLIRFSAKTERSLEAYAQRLSDFIDRETSASLYDLSYSLHRTRHPFNHRRFIVAGDTESLKVKLNAAPLISESSVLKERIERIVFVFPGQGSQFVNMGLELYQNEPVFAGAIDECAYLLYEFMGEDIRTIIYPGTGNVEQSTAIDDTRYTQPAIFVFEYALAKLWMSWGIQPAVFIGHSIGEFVAAHLAGVFTLTDALMLIEARGRLMSALPAGSMLSVRADIKSLSPLMPAGISIAAANSRTATVVAGETNRVNAFAELLNEKGIGNKLLYTSHAFHSSMMKPVEAPFEELVRSTVRKAPSVPIISTVTGKLLSADEAIDPGYWSNHLLAPVLFADAVDELISGPSTLFLEIGPRNVTTTLVKQQAAQKKIAAIPSLQPDPNGHHAYGELLQAVGQLWLLDINVNFSKIFDDKQSPGIELPSYAFDKKKYWVTAAQTSMAIHAQGLIQMSVPQLNLTAPKIITNPETLIDPTQTQNMRKNSIISTIRKIMEEASGFEMANVPASLSFIEAGLDSLLLTQIALTLKKHFPVPVSFRQLNEEYDSIEKLAAYYDLSLPATYAQPVQQPLPAQTSTLINQQARTADQLTATRGFDNYQVTTPSASFPRYNADNSALGLIAQQMEILAKQIALLQGSQYVADIRQEQHTVKVAGTSGNQIKTQEPEITSEEATELKKPFGATARIEQHSSVLTEEQQIFITALAKKYNEKTKSSKNYTQKYRATMADPRVVSGFRPVTKELVYPLVMNKSMGSRLWDIDGNEYIDLLNGFGSSLLGYQPEFIKKAMHTQIDTGYEIGPQHELAGPVCKLICEFTGADRAALCNTGSEAVLGAMRIARTVTGRSLIVAFNGSYHGIVDEVIVRGTKKLKTYPAAPGIMPESVQNMLILDYGTDESLRIIRERADELAAVLVEPVQSRRPEFQPVAFLKEIREITSKSGTALIFDEVITGFRMHPGGAQALFGIKADLGTYGKVVGAGISIGVIAGTSAFMNALDGGYWQYGDASIPEAGVTYFAGTFVRHPLALAASKASLEYMKSKGPALQENISAKTKRLADGLNSLFETYGLPIFTARFGSLWKIKFKEDIPYSELLFTLMRNRGFHILDNFPCFLSEAHTEHEIDLVLQAFADSIAEMIDAGFFKPTNHPADHPRVTFRVENQPPVPGSRLGKDSDGNPAWFISNPDQPGQFLQLNKK